ncbi:MAG: hypothetical protein BJ554DRAFT_6996, partial [Olpidium bornovanus]
MSNWGYGHRERTLLKSSRWPNIDLTKKKKKLYDADLSKPSERSRSRGKFVAKLETASSGRGKAKMPRRPLIDCKRGPGDPAGRGLAESELFFSVPVKKFFFRAAPHSPAKITTRGSSLLGSPLKHEKKKKKKNPNVARARAPRRGNPSRRG